MTLPPSLAAFSRDGDGDEENAAFASLLVKFVQSSVSHSGCRRGPPRSEPVPRQG
jgi:hypothetical protein